MKCSVSAKYQLEVTPQGRKASCISYHKHYTNSFTFKNLLLYFMELLITLSMSFLPVRTNEITGILSPEVSNICFFLVQFQHLYAEVYELTLQLFSTKQFI